MTSQRTERTRPKLLVLASTYPRWAGDAEPGFVHELSKRLSRDFDVTVVCPSAKGAVARERMDDVDIIRFRYASFSLETLVNDGGITSNLRRKPWKYMLVPFFLAGMIWTTWRSARALRPDLVHAHWLLPQGIVATLALGMRVPLVATVHGADLYAWRSPIFDPIKRLVVRRAAVVTVVSSAMVDEVVKLGIDECRISVAPMGVDLEHRFTPGSGARPPADILFVGRLVEKKGLRHLVAAMPIIKASFPDAKLTVVGFGPEMAELDAQVHALMLDDSVKLVGAVSQEDLPRIYRRATVFVAPFVQAGDGDRDGLGLVLVEAVGCGCPVVVSDIPAIHDVFRKGDAILVPPGDPAGIAQGVSTILAGNFQPHLDLRDRLFRRFDWDRVADRYREIFYSVLSKRT